MAQASTHSSAPAIDDPAGHVDAALLCEAYRAVVRLGRRINLPELRNIDYEEDHDSQFRFANAGREVFVTLRDDNYISRQLAMFGYFDFDDFERAVSVLGGPVGTLLDVGANIGPISVPAVARGLAARAIAFEPDPLNYRTLMANLYLNDLVGRVTAINTALGEHPDETLEFQLSPDNKGDHRVIAPELSGPDALGENVWQTCQVSSTSLDAISNELSIVPGSDTLLWMDVQGWEAKVLRGATALLAARTPTVIEFWPYGMRRNGMLDELIGLLCGSFTQMTIISDPSCHGEPVSADALGRIVERLDPGGVLSACDILFR